MLMSTAMVWYRTSPKLYDNLYNSDLLVLLHRLILRRLTFAFSTKKGQEVRTIKYLKLRISKLRAQVEAGELGNG